MKAVFGASCNLKTDFSVDSRINSGNMINIILKGLEKTAKWSYLKKSTHIMSPNVCLQDVGRT